MMGEIFRVMKVTIGELDGDSLYGDFLNGIYIKGEGKNKIEWEGTNELREGISEAFLTNNFRKFVKYFIPKNKHYIILHNDAEKILEKIIINWRWIKLGIPKEHLETIKKSGNVIAEVCIHNNLNLLYKLDKVRTSEEFWSVMREISRKMISLDAENTKYINPMVLGDLISLVKEYEKDWKELRDLLEIYSCMYISIKQYKPEDNNNDNK